MRHGEILPATGVSAMDLHAVPNHQSPTTNHYLPITDHQFLPACCDLCTLLNSASMNGGRPAHRLLRSAGLRFEAALQANPFVKAEREMKQEKQEEML